MSHLSVAPEAGQVASTSEAVNRHPARLISLSFGLLLLSLPIATVSAQESWNFRLSPYGWLAGLEGDIASTAAVPAAPVDVTPSDVIEDLETAAMLIFSAKRGRHGIFTDLFYADLQSGMELIPQPIGLRANVGAETTIFSAAYQYEFFRSQSASADILLGARYWSVESVLIFSGGAGQLAGLKLSSSEDWTDPLVGIKGHRSLGNSRFYVEGGASIGGFGAGSDLYTEFSGVIGYRWNKAISTAFGYRRYDVDYADGGFIYDVTQQGLQFGLSWAF
jgi:hypothetical protein